MENQMNLDVNELQINERAQEAAKKFAEQVKDL